MDTVFGILIGVGLAASCGFRVFVPMLVMSIAVKSGHLEVAPGWEWIGSWSAMTAFGVAMIVEIAGFYVPWLDNLLDTISTPAAVIAGTVATAACVTHMSPLMQWSTAIIAGGGIAGTIQGTTVLARGTSTVTTAGGANFMVATIELFASILLSIMAVIVPVLALLVLCGIGFWAIKMLIRRPAKKPSPLSA